MSIKTDRVAEFWRATLQLSYLEMKHVTDEIAGMITDTGQPMDEMIADALTAAAIKQPSGPATRGV